MPSCCHLMFPGKTVHKNEEEARITSQEGWMRRLWPTSVIQAEAVSLGSVQSSEVGRLSGAFLSTEKCGKDHLPLVLFKVCFKFGPYLDLDLFFDYYFSFGFRKANPKFWKGHRTTRGSSESAAASPGPQSDWFGRWMTSTTRSRPKSHLAHGGASKSMEKRVWFGFHPRL